MPTVYSKIRRHTGGGLKAFVFMVMGCFVANVIYGFSQNVYKHYVKSQPFEQYAVYYDVKPLKDTFSVGEELWFVSDSEFKRPVSAVWNDVLFCDFGDGESFVTSYQTSKDYVEPRERKSTKWNFNYAVKKPATCRLESSVKIKVEFDVEKNDIVHGQEFRVQ